MSTLMSDISYNGWQLLLICSASFMMTGIGFAAFVVAIEFMRDFWFGGKEHLDHAALLDWLDL